MFDSLDETMRKDAKSASSTSERLVIWVVVAAASVLVFAGLYYGIRVVG